MMTALFEMNALDGSDDSLGSRCGILRTAIFDPDGTAEVSGEAWGKND
jgi:hypothetical protein